MKCEARVCVVWPEKYLWVSVWRSSCESESNSQQMCWITISLHTPSYPHLTFFQYRCVTNVLFLNSWIFDMLCLICSVSAPSLVPFTCFTSLNLPSGLKPGLKPPSSGLCSMSYLAGLFKNDLIWSLLQSFLKQKAFSEYRKLHIFPYSAFNWHL